LKTHLDEIGGDMKTAGAILFCMTLMMGMCDNNKKGDQFVVMRNDSTHNCALMSATTMRSMGSTAGMPHKLGTYASTQQAIDALAAFQRQVDPDNPIRKVCE
jgi:hypothetical protein